MTAETMRSARGERHGKPSRRELAKRKTVIQTKAIVPISVFAIPGLLAIECAMHQHSQTGGTAPKVTVKIDAGLKKKSPRAALACVTARETAGGPPPAGVAEREAGGNARQGWTHLRGGGGVAQKKPNLA